MWGDPQRASNLEQSDALSGLLLQVTGPAHVPWNDPRWQELLHGYDVWVHLEYRTHHLEHDRDLVRAACTSMAKHASTSSNLAALALHVGRMVRDLQKTVTTPVDPHGAADDFSRRIVLIGKARATAGALHLMRILLHDIMVITSSSTDDMTLQEVFLYVSRDMSERTRGGRDAGVELLSALLSFLSCMGDPASDDERGGTLSQLVSVPELYDATVMSIELLLVLLSSQLYQPMLSSAQRRELSVRQLVKGPLPAPEKGNHFLDQVMSEADKRQRQQRKRQREQQEAFLMATDNYQSALGYEQPLVNHTNYTTGKSKDGDEPHDWSPQSVLKACITWLIQRPAAPFRSIAHHNAELARSVVHAKGEKMSPDGMFESYAVVLAAREGSGTAAKDGDVADSEEGGSDAARQVTSLRPPSRVILDATKGVLVLSSKLILLPFRLMTLAVGLWGQYYMHHQRLTASGDGSQFRMIQLNSKRSSSRTRDVLWLTDSPVADLGCALFLLLTNNNRAPPLPEEGLDYESNSHAAESHGNPFRSELAALNDNRWEGSGSFATVTEPSSLDPLLPPVQDNGGGGLGMETQFDSFVNEDGDSATPPLRPRPSTLSPPRQLLTTNFESLFEAFGNILHTEVGALSLYTVLQSSPIFAASMAVRSDLDTLVVPLLRTLYFASTLRHFSPDSAKSPSNSNLAIRQRLHSLEDGPQSASLVLKSCPFRSASQLYVILILLLLFSQDASFGSDAFRRVMVTDVPWYKERNLKEINLGSLLVLSLLRSISFNINRLHDAFLLSNCCAVLMNLSPSTVNLHEYAAMRLASVTMSSLKRYSLLVDRNGGTVSAEEDITTVLGMYGEVSRTLLRLLRHCVGPKNIDKNLHLVYALVYHQADFQSVMSKKNCPFKASEFGRLQIVIAKASEVIQEDGDARTAPKALNVLEKSMDRLKEAVSSGHKVKLRKGSMESSSSDSTSVEGGGDFTFTYEEESDPEIFFIPYVWEVVVCVVTASTVEWDKDSIQVFPLLEPEEEDVAEGNGAAATAQWNGGYSQDVSDVV